MKRIAVILCAPAPAAGSLCACGNELTFDNYEVPLVFTR